MRLSHAAARKYVLIMYMLITGNGSQSWQADEDAVSDVIISTREYGPVLHVGGEILQLTHEDRNDGCAVHFASVCLGPGTKSDGSRLRPSRVVM